MTEDLQLVSCVTKIKITEFTNKGTEVELVSDFYYTRHFKTKSSKEHLVLHTFGFIDHIQEFKEQ